MTIGGVLESTRAGPAAIEAAGTVPSDVKSGEVAGPRQIT
jgi:hypothetical protein